MFFILVFTFHFFSGAARSINLRIKFISYQHDRRNTTAIECWPLQKRTMWITNAFVPLAICDAANYSSAIKFLLRFHESTLEGRRRTTTDYMSKATLILSCYLFRTLTLRPLIITPAAHDHQHRKINISKEETLIIEFLNL